MRKTYDADIVPIKKRVRVLGSFLTLWSDFTGKKNSSWLVDVIRRG